MGKYLLLDGYNMGFRAYYALPDLTRKDGFPTGALHGWVKTIWKLQDMEQPDAIIVFFDKGGSDRHLALLPEYKANRTETPEPFKTQLPYFGRLSELMGCAVVEREGVEADDLIASAATKLADLGHEVVIVSADKDLGQCVSGQISQLLPAPTANPRIGWRKLDVDGVREKFGVPPERVPDYLALIGDTSDNIGGLPGVGPKTAVNWLTAFGNIDGILSNANALKPVRFAAIVPEQEPVLRRNLQLVTLEHHHPIASFDCPAPRPAELAALLEEMEMATAAKQSRERYELKLF